MRLRLLAARAGAGIRPVCALAFACAVAAALLVTQAAVVRLVDAQDVRTALAAASDSGRVATITATGATGDELAEVSAGVLRIHRVEGAVVTPGDGHAEISLDTSRVTGDDARGLAAALADLPAEVRSALGVRAQLGGGLPSTLDAATSGLDTRRGPALIATVMLGLLTLLVVGAIALEPVRARAAETTLLRARGARRRTLLSLAATETLATAGAGAAVGAGLSLFVSVLLGVPHPGVLFAAAAAGIIAVTATVVAATAMLRRTAMRAEMRTGRASLFAGAATAVILAVVTALGAWRFAESGSPLTTGGGIDPLVVAAPALVLALAALLAFLGATITARVVAVALARGRGVNPVTPLRLAARRPARHALPLTVVAFAIGAIIVAAGFTGTVRALGDAPEALRVGTDVRVTSIPDTLDPGAVRDTATASGARAAALARSFSAQATGARIPVLAMESPALSEVMSDAAGTLDPAEIGSIVGGEAFGIPLAGPSLQLRVRTPLPAPVDVGDGELYQPDRPLVTVRISFVSDEGRFWEASVLNGDIETQERSDDVLAAGIGEAERVVPVSMPGGGPWRLVAISIAMADGAGVRVDADITIEVLDGASALTLSTLTIAPGSSGTVTPVDAGLQFALAAATSGDAAPVRAVATAARDAAAALPVVLTRALADTLGLAEGDRIALSFESPRMDADVTIAGIVPVLPGTPAGQGMVADLARFSLVGAAPLVPNQLWVAADDPAAVAAALGEAYPSTQVLVADPRQGDAAAGTAWAFLVAGLGALALAAVVLLLRRGSSREDARELALLSVLGLGRRGAARVRRAEDLFALLLGVVGGVVAGLATAWLIVPPLARAAYGSIPTAYPVPLVWPWLEGAIAVAVATGLLAAIAASSRAPKALALALREDE